eukprot:COSAG01_NODE_4362_length_5097_cov_29.636455_3_plen_76_part_00
MVASAICWIVVLIRAHVCDTGQAPRSSILASRAGGRGDLTASSLKPSQVNPLEMATAQEAAMAERFGLHMSLGVK